MGRETPLFTLHRSLGARIIDFGGWSMPLHYGSQVEEHHAVRRAAGVFDVSHMGIVDVAGPDARALLETLLANDVGKLESAGKALYSCMLEESGGVVDDLIVYFLGPEQGFRVVVNGATRDGDLAWIRSHAAGRNVLAHHRSRGDLARREIIVPEAAHGTNPATASMCGGAVREIPVGADGDVNIEALKAAVGPGTAGIMLTNPSTLGVFERRILEVAEIVHAAGGLLYYDGANLNAILGKVRPADMGFDVIHVNLHKTFSTPHGGGGPGAGAVGVGPRLEPFLPTPIVAKEAERYRWLTQRDRPQSIGRLSAFMGNTGVLLRAYVYMRLLGREGMSRVAEHAALNANYLLARLLQAGFEAAYPSHRASHELIITVRRQARDTEVTAMDFAKRLLDYGMHAPTTYFPLLVPECLLIEPTETESKETLDAFVDAMVSIAREAREDPERVRSAPHTLPVRRLDDVRAAKQLDLAWKPGARAPDRPR